jgi:ssDNA-binding Zn-finger/Zn-ribbon topoisomerase 1
MESKPPSQPIRAEAPQTIGARMKKPKLVNLAEVDIYCPDCKDLGRGAVKLIVRTARASGSQFLGCPNWPDCFYTRQIPESMIMRANGQQELFTIDETGSRKTP